MTDEALQSYRGIPIANLKERKSIISDLRCVDMIMVQERLDPTENLKKIHEQFSSAKIILVYGSNWKDIPGAEYIRKINGKIVQPPFYDKLSTKNIIKKISKYKETAEVK